MLFMFLFVPKRSELCINGSYMTKLNELGVSNDIVYANKQRFKPYSELVDNIHGYLPSFYDGLTTLETTI